MMHSNFCKFCSISPLDGEAGFSFKVGFSSALLDSGQALCLLVGCQGDVGSLRYSPLLLVSWMAAGLEGKYTMSPAEMP